MMVAPAAREQLFVNLKTLALRLGLPESFLKSELAAGRLPFLKVGNRQRFNVAAVERALTANSKESSSAGTLPAPCVAAR